ncbi:MAG: Fe2+-dependent dioxygenase [Steroidobacteraceae bacterium]
MIVRIPGVLPADHLANMQSRLESAAWEDGRLTAGHQSSQVKNNMQLPQTDATARALSEEVLRALERNALFISATLPRHVYPPLFNRFRSGMTFGAHIDNAIRQIPGTPHRLRTDLAATLFLSSPDSYDGGELVIEDTFGPQSVKLPAGDMVVYSATGIHRVEAVTGGTRTAAFFWIQSMVQDDGARTLMFELDTAIRELTRAGVAAEPLVRLTACYHNLLRRWATL